MGAEGRLERVEGAEEVGPLAVEHVDEDQPRQPLGVGPPPEPLGVDLDPHHAVDDDHRGVGDPQGGDRVGDEARLARRVDQVDLAAAVLEAGERGVDRHRPLLLVGLVVGDGRAVGHRAEPVDRAGLEQHRLVQARLAAAPVPDQGDIANPVCGLVRHATEGTPAGRQNSTGINTGQAALEAGLQPHHGLGVQLRDARLGDAEHLADLAQGEVLVVVEGDDELLALGQRGDRLGEAVLDLAAGQRLLRVVGARVGDRVEQRDLSRRRSPRRSRARRARRPRSWRSPAARSAVRPR